MAVLNLWWPQAGLVPNTTQTNSANTLPTFVYIQTNNTLAEVTVAGYLNKAAQMYGAGSFNNSQMALVTTSDEGVVTLKVVVAFSGSTASYSLETPAQGSGSFSSVTLGDGTAAAPSLNFESDTTTGLYRAASDTIGFAVNGAAAASMSATAFAMLGNLVAGASGTAGTVASYPATASKGSLKLVAVANTGNTDTTISNAAMGQASTVSIPDPEAATSDFVLNNATVDAGSSAGSWGNATPPTPTKVMTIVIGGVTYYCPLVAQNT